MGNLRFALLAVALFAVTFGGISWATRGFPGLAPSTAPALATRAAPPKPEVRVAAIEPVALVTTPKPTIRESAKESIPEAVVETAKPAVKENVVASIKPPAPIEPDEPKPTLKSWFGGGETGRDQMRKTAIQAANAYALSPCDQANKAAFIVATSTYVGAVTGKTDDTSAANDARVRKAIQAAFETGGVTKDEFPSGAQSWVADIPASRSARAAPCGIGRRAENVRP